MTLTIVYYSQEMPVQKIFIEQLSIQHWKISASGHGSVWKWGYLNFFSANHTKLNINGTNTCSKVNYKKPSVTSNIVAL